MTKLEIMEKVMAISALALELSNNAWDESTRAEKPIAFLRFNGHVGDIDIELYENGWNEESPTHRWEIQYKHDHYGKSCSVDRLDEIIAEMSRLAEIRYKMENTEVE
jgi:hypothetical protein